MSLLPTWDPIRLEQKIPFNLALCGGRRQGKSTSLADLLHRMSGRFALVIAFIGSAACNPVLEELMSLHWDPRFFFSAWRPKLIDALLQQQEALKRAGKNRQILIVIDDCILDGPAVKQLSNMAMRGRHFNVSLAACAVSYVSLPKAVRRSLDCLMLFSCPMAGDLKVLTWEFARKAAMARFALDHLEPYECLVLETLQRRQELFNWKARCLTVAALRGEEPPPRISGASVREGSRSAGGPGSGAGSPSARRPRARSGSGCSTQSSEGGAPAGSDPPEAPACP